MKHALAFALILAALPASAEGGRPRVYGMRTNESYTNIVVTTYDSKDNSYTSFFLGDGGMICGPAEIIYQDKDGKREAFKLGPGRCSGGFYPNVVLDKPEPALPTTIYQEWWGVCAGPPVEIPIGQSGNPYEGIPHTELHHTEPRQ